jgi:hypothetical protein
MSQARRKSTPSTIVDAARLQERRGQAQERRSQELRWVFADLTSRLPPGVMLAVVQAVTMDSEQPLTTLPTKYPRRAIAAFRASKQALGKVLMFPAAR